MIVSIPCPVSSILSDIILNLATQNDEHQRTDRRQLHEYAQLTIGLDSTGCRNSGVMAA